MALVGAALFGAVLAIGVEAYRFVARPAPEAPPKLPFDKGGVKVSLVSAAGVGAPGADAAAGDWLLESDRLRLVVGGEGSGLERRLRYGGIVDLTVEDFADDELVELRPVLQIAGTLVGLRTDAVKLDVRGARPLIRLVQAARDGSATVDTTLRIAPGESFAELISRVKNASPSALSSVQVGDRTRWRGASSFAPRVGFVSAALHAEVPWVGSTGTKLTYALTFPEGPAEASFIFDRVGSSGQVTLSKPRDLTPGDDFVYTRRVIVVASGLGRAAEIAWRSLGKPIGWIDGTLKPVPRWATVEARSPDGHTVLSVRSDEQGAYELPLPPGDYQVVLRAPGGQDEAAVRVAAGARVTPSLFGPRPGNLHYSIQDSAGKALPARLVVRGIAPTDNPEFGPVEAAVGAKNVVYTSTGEGYLELPPGRYRVLATHGMEYSIAAEEVEVNPDVGATFRAELARQVDTAGFVACDFHLHQAPSYDSSVALEDRVLALLAEGVEFAVPTDHNHITDFSETLAALNLEEAIATAPGVEITTQTWGHFNAFPYPKAAPPPPVAGAEPTEIFAHVRARAPEAVIQVNHPRMPGVGYFNRGELYAKANLAVTEGFSFDFDTLEVSNGFDLENPRRLDEDLHEWFDLLNVGRRYTAVGNSDSHRLVYQWAGYPRTYVRVHDDGPGRFNAAEIAHALLLGHAVVANGIFIVALANGKASAGDLLHGGRVTLQMSVRAPSWVDVRQVEVYANGSRVASHAVSALATGALRAQWEADFDFHSDTWLVVFARGEEPMLDVLGKYIKPFAFTNPIFVDANADGVFRAPGPVEAPAPGN